MSTNEFFHYLMKNTETEDLAAQLASAYLQRVCAPIAESAASAA